MSKKQAPVEKVIRRNEDIYWKGRPEKTPYIFNDIKDYILDLSLQFLFNILLIPYLVLNFANFSIWILLILFVLWCFHIANFIKLIARPIQKAREWKDIYYVITDQHFYVQFGNGNDIFYRMYPIDRIGTKVFYRKNTIDSIFEVGTIGISVDDYYEERVVSVKDFEDVYRIFKGFTDTRQIEERQKAVLRAKQAEQDRLEEIERIKREKEEAAKQAKLEEEKKAYELNLEKEYAHNDTLEDQINNTPKFETYEEYKMRTRNSLEESRREELRREEAKRRAAEARYRSQLRQQEAERIARKHFEDDEDEDDNVFYGKKDPFLSSDTLSEIMDMQEECLQNSKAIKPQQKKKPPKKKNKSSYNIEPMQKPSIENKKGKSRYDGDDAVPVKEMKKEEVENSLDLSSLWNNKNKK